MRHEYCSSELKLVNLLTDKDGAKMLLQQDGVMVKQHCTVSHWNSQYGLSAILVFVCFCASVACATSLGSELSGVCLTETTRYIFRVVDPCKDYHLWSHVG